MEKYWIAELTWITSYEQNTLTHNAHVTENPKQNYENFHVDNHRLASISMLKSSSYGVELNVNGLPKLLALNLNFSDGVR